MCRNASVGDIGPAYAGRGYVPDTRFTREVGLR